MACGWPLWASVFPPVPALVSQAYVCGSEGLGQCQGGQRGEEGGPEDTSGMATVPQPQVLTVPTWKVTLVVTILSLSA